MKKQLFALAAMLCTCNALAQYSVSGTVRDSATGNPLSSAHVIIENSFAGTFTDADGAFHLNNISSSAIALKISYLGYKTQVINLTLGGNGTTQVLLSKDAVLADEVVITATRADEKSAMAYRNLGKDEIESRNFGQDVPYILSMTPSAVVTSDAGNGIGYTGIRIRGSDASRINVTINGIPVNDGESQLVYWVDLPDLSSSTDNIQVQRGVGTSTNGAGAFGASINLLTNRLRTQPYVESSHAAGSFGSVKNNISAGTGLVGNHWTFDARLSKITSDGYIDRATSNLKSIFISQGFYDKNTMLRLNIFTGKEVTYQSWYGTPEAVINNDVQGMIDFTIRNGLDSPDSLNLLTSGRTYNYYTYKNQVDDYQQDNYQLHFSQQLSPRVNFTGALHYTKGRGFYEEYKKNQSLLDYGVTDSVPGFVFGSVNLIRRKWLDNDFYGAVYSLHYNPQKNFSIILGGGWNRYAGDHFDEVIWAEFLPVASVPFRYDDNSARKTDFNFFGKAIYDISKNVTAFADMQFRRVSYNFSAFDINNQFVPQSDELHFVNPKAGITVKPDERQTIYASIAAGSKEPSRNDYVNNPFRLRPNAEKLYDFEGGYRYRMQKIFGAVNFYHMMYDNQLVLNGSVNDVGEPLRINVKNSYRQGAELEAGWKIHPKLSLLANATLSRNKIKRYDEIVFDYDSYTNDSTSYKNTDIAYSPSVIAGGEIIAEPQKNISLAFSSKYVGKQYLDNTSNEKRKLDAYWYSDFRAGYVIRTKLVSEIRMGILVNNIFNKLYESNGYTYSYIYGGETTTENFYYPQAGTNILAQVTFKF